jgi:DNA sulfur modification protein DndC
MEARRYGLSVVLCIQDEINAAAREQGRPLVDLINEEEYARILALIDANTWPYRWDGTEETGDKKIQRERDEQEKHSLWAALESTH